MPWLLINFQYKAFFYSKVIKKICAKILSLVLSFNSIPPKAIQ